MRTYNLRTRKSSSWRPSLPTSSRMTEHLNSSSLGWEPKGSKAASSEAKQTERLLCLGGKVTTASGVSSFRSGRRSGWSRFDLFLGGSSFAPAIGSFSRLTALRVLTTCSDLVFRAATNSETLLVWVMRHFFALSTCLVKHPEQNRPCAHPYSTGLPQAGPCLDGRAEQPSKADKQEDWVILRFWFEVVTASFFANPADLRKSALRVLCGHVGQKLAPPAILEVLGDVFLNIFGHNLIHSFFNLWHDLWQAGRASTDLQVSRFISLLSSLDTVSRLIQRKYSRIVVFEKFGSLEKLWTWLPYDVRPIPRATCNYRLQPVIHRVRKLGRT